LVKIFSYYLYLLIARCVHILLAIYSHVLNLFLVVDE